MRLYRAIEVIESQECLLQMKMSDYPNMKEPARKKLHRAMYKKAYPTDEKGLPAEEAIKRLQAWQMNG